MDYEKKVVVQPSPPSRADPDPRQSLQHVLATTDIAGQDGPRQSYFQSSPLVSPLKDSSQATQDEEKENAQDERSVQNDSYTRAADINPSHTMTVAHSRRNANGTIGSVYSGNKIRHLKKEDGIPLWRKDIQFAFLKAVFEDTTPVFTKYFDRSKGHTFADIYIDAMAKSSKTSKILREKLLAEREAALNMAMVCLLVNVGRMNTTLNFFPEMRAQLRTYHSIPCLQAHQDPNAYKQLQDAPRLKSILKGASEDADQPTTLEKIESLPVPRTNPVNLIFVLSQYAPKISETHFDQPRDFFDLVIRATLSSRSRAKSFLWLIWWYLESDYTREDALKNPFGPGRPDEKDPNGLPLRVPAFEHLTEQQADAENVDSQAEIDFGELKRQERKRILEEDETVGPPLKKSKKAAALLGNHLDDGLGSSPARFLLPSDEDRTRSPSPSNYDATTTIRVNGLGRQRISNGQQPLAPNMDSLKGSNSRLIFKTKMEQTRDTLSPAPPGSGHPILQSHVSGHGGHRRSRPETSHQKAVNMNRKMRIEHILHKQLKEEHARVRRKKKAEGSSFGFMVMSRIQDLRHDYDTEDEYSWGPGGLVPNPPEREDYGGDALRHRKILDRAMRRLAREGEGGNRPVGRLMDTYRGRNRKAKGIKGESKESERVTPRKRSKIMADRVSSQPGKSRDDGLDDLDLDLLGESSEDGQDQESGPDGDDSEGGVGDTEDEMMDEG